MANDIERYQQPHLDINQIIRVAEVLANSKRFPSGLEMEQAAAAIFAGQELGLGPVASLNNLHIINGRISISAKMMAALIKRSGRYDYRVDWPENVDEGCTVRILQRKGDGWEELGKSTFNRQDALRAELIKSGGNYAKYPRNMYFSRALTNAVSWYAPDVLAGQDVYASDDEVPQVVVSHPEPQVETDPLQPFFDTAESFGYADRNEVLEAVESFGYSEISSENQGAILAELYTNLAEQRKETASN